MEQDTPLLSRRTPEAISRRTMIRSGAAASAVIWAAPSIISLDSVAAATGSCLVAPRQVDFSRFAGGALPANFLSDDGSVSINFSVVDPWGVSQVGYTGVAWNSVLNGLDNPVITAMQNARSGRYVDLIFQFSTPVCPSFSLVDVDRSTFNWEDTVRVIGSNGGGTINPSAMTVGGAQVQTNPNTVRGTSSTSSATGNVGIEFDQPITRLEIRHQDNSNWTAFQWIGIHDFHWC